MAAPGVKRPRAGLRHGNLLTEARTVALPTRMHRAVLGAQRRFWRTARACPRRVRRRLSVVVRVSGPGRLWDCLSLTVMPRTGVPPARSRLLWVARGGSYVRVHRGQAFRILGRAPGLGDAMAWLLVLFWESTGLCVSLARSSGSTGAVLRARSVRSRRRRHLLRTGPIVGHTGGQQAAAVAIGPAEQRGVATGRRRPGHVPEAQIAVCVWIEHRDPASTHALGVMQ